MAIREAADARNVSMAAKSEAISARRTAMEAGREAPRATQKMHQAQKKTESAVEQAKEANMKAEKAIAFANTAQSETDRIKRQYSSLAEKYISLVRRFNELLGAALMDEVLSIKIGHVNFDANKPYINIYGKGDKLRTSYLLPRTVALLRKYMEEVHGLSPDPNRLLFYRRVGGNYKKLTEAAMDKRIKICQNRP